MITGLTFAIITSDDFARTRAFYTERLGLAVDPANDAPGFSLLATQGGSGFAVQSSDAPGVELYLQSDDVDATYAAWQAAGVELIDSPHDEPFGRLFAFRDPDGRTVYCWQPAG